MDIKLFMILTILCPSPAYCKQECITGQTQTFEVDAEVTTSFRAEIKELRGLVIDINYENRKNDRIKLSSKESLTYKHDGTKYNREKIGYYITEGWHEFNLMVKNNTLMVTCIDSLKQPLEIIIHRGIKSIKVSSANIMICKESCSIEKNIEKNIENEELFNLTVFTTSITPIEFKISSRAEGEPFRYFVMKPSECTYEGDRVPCNYIHQGWNKLDIFANRSSLSINNNILPVDGNLRTLSISGDYIVNCTKGTPTWNISREELPIPIYSRQEIMFTLASAVKFSPVFNLDGDEWTLNWNNGLFIKFGTSGIAMDPSVYNIIFKVSSNKLTIYDKDKQEIIMDKKLEKTPEKLLVSSTMGVFQLSLFVEDSSQKPTDPVPSTEPVPETRISPNNASSSSKTIWVITISVLLSLAGIGIIISILFKRWRGKPYTKKINAFEEGKSLLPMEDQDSLKNTIRSSFTEIHGEKNPQMSPHNKEVCKIKLKSEKKNDYVKMIGKLERNKETKTILVVGQTGSGKSSFINAMVNNIYGVEYEDSFRFKLIDDMDTIGNPDDSGIQNTDKITAYYIPHMHGIKLDCNYIFIDTPGYGSTNHIDEDKKWNVEFYDFLKKTNVGEVDAICFVIKANYTRLTLEQEYIINTLFSNFGKDIKNNTYTVVSYSDGLDTDVPVLLQKSGLDFKLALKFNSIGIYNDETFDPDSSKDVQNKFWKKWKLTMRNINIFIEKIKQSSPVCLTLTNIVLEEYKDIEKLKDEMLELSAKCYDATDEEMQEIQSRIEQNQELLMSKLDDAQKLSGRLKDIPLIKKNPLVVNDYIDLLIQCEEDKTKRSGLHKLKERNKSFHNLLKEKSTTKSLMQIILPRNAEKID